jgi:hypothetical protein
LLPEDVLTGIPTELFLGVVHLVRSIFSRIGERVLTLMTVFVLVVLLVCLLPRGMNSVHVISHSHVYIAGVMLESPTLYLGILKFH